MIIIPLLCLLAFGLIVSLIGLYVLAYSKKEALGKAYKFTSYATITVGVLICVHALIFAVVVSTCHSGGCYGKGGFKMRTEMHGDCGYGGGSCDHHSFKKSSCEGEACGPHRKMKCEKSCSHDGTMMEKEVIVKVIEDEDDEQEAEE